MVFVGRLDAQLVALDQRTGKPVWTIQAEDPAQAYSIVSAPLYYDGMVITGFGGGDLGARGRVKAYDAKTGKLVWTFYTIPGPGEFGHETWPADNEAWKYGGAPVWNTPAVDPQLGLIYFSTGNAGPDFNGSGRKGDNLFTVSIVAVDVKTGKYRWHFQQVHHDIWDYDSPNPVILFEAPYEGRMRKAIAEVSKTGWVYILDRETGKPLTPIEERPVPQEPRQHTAATQPYVIGDAVAPQEIDIPPEGFEPVNHGRIFTPFWDKVVLYKPQMARELAAEFLRPGHASHVHLRHRPCGLIGERHAALDPSRPGRPPHGWRRRESRRRAARHVHGNGPDYQSHRLAAAVAQQLLQRHAGHGGRTGVRGPLRWPLHRAGRRQWQAAVAVPDRCGCGGLGQHLRIPRPTVRRGALRGHAVRRRQQRRQPVAVLARRHHRVTAARAAPGRGSGSRHRSAAGARESRAGRSHLSPVLRRLPRRAGHRRQGGGASLVNVSRDMQAIANTAAAGRNTMPAFRLMLSAEQLRDVAGYISTELFPAHPQ